MKRLVDEITLKNKLEYITMMDLRQHPGEILTSVSYGKTYIVKRKSEIIAVISKPPGLNLTMDVGSNGEVVYHL